MNKLRRGLDLFAGNERSYFLKEITRYFQQERGEEIGVIAAESVLDFILQKIGPVIYNKAVDDTKMVVKKQLEVLDFDFDLLKKQ